MCAINLEIEFRLDGKHEVDHVERGEPARSKIVIVSDGTVPRALGKKAAHQGGHASSRVVLRAIEHGKFLAFAGFVGIAMISTACDVANYYPIYSSSYGVD